MMLYRLLCWFEAEWEGEWFLDWASMDLDDCRAMDVVEGRH